MDQFRRPLTNTAEEFFSCAYDVLSRDMSSQTLLRLAVELAAASNRFVHLSGIEKAQFVQTLLLDVLKQIEKELPDCQEDLTQQLSQARVFVQDLLPQLLNVAVDVAKGRIQFEKAVSTGVSCLAMILSCLPSKAKTRSVATAAPVGAHVKALEDSSVDVVHSVNQDEEDKEKMFEPREPEEPKKESELGTAEIPVPTYEVRLSIGEAPAKLPPLPESRAETPSPVETPSNPVTESQQTA